MKQTIQIKSISAKLSQADKTYWEVQTDKGRMSAHDEDIAKKLSNVWSNGTFAEVETHTSEDGKWVNIRKFITEVKVYSPSAEASKVPPSERIGAKPAYQPGIQANKNTTMYASYAKDVFIALIDKTKGDLPGEGLMAHSIKLVKQAKKAFE